VPSCRAGVTWQQKGKILPLPGIKKQSHSHSHMLVIIKPSNLRKLKYIFKPLLPYLSVKGNNKCCCLLQDNVVQPLDPLQYDDKMHYARFEFLVALLLRIPIFWDVTICCWTSGS